MQAFVISRATLFKRRKKEILAKFENMKIEI
jgi:hypothetical protein